MKHEHVGFVGRFSRCQSVSESKAVRAICHGERLEPGKKRLSGNTVREATSDEWYQLYLEAGLEALHGRASRTKPR